MTEARRAHAEARDRVRAGDLLGASTAFAAAAEGYRSGTGSDTELSDLCDVLCAWAEVLTSLGQPRAAVDRAAEAVDVLRRRSMLGDGAVPSPQAAQALLVLGTAELRAGDPAAGADLDAAVATARRVSIALPTDDNRELLAIARNHQSSLALAADRLDDALAAATESVDIRAELATTDPDRYNGRLGSSLNNLATVHGARLDFARAASTAMKACEVLARRAEAGEPGATANLAAAQSNAAAFLGDVPDLERAVEFGTRAVEGYQQLVNAHPPPAFVTELAKALVVLATCVAGDEHFDLAADFAHGAIALLVQHADLLAMRDFAFVDEAARYYHAFTVESGAELDTDLIDAAYEALAASAVRRTTG